MKYIISLLFTFKILVHTLKLMFNFLKIFYRVVVITQGRF